MDDLTTYVSPLPNINGRKKGVSRADLFWEKVDKHGSMHPVLKTRCWNWTASTYTNGYGQFWTGTGLTGAHRFANTLTYGPIPDGLQVLHHCDNKLCCNPEHHFRGTTQDNVDDLHAKGLNRQAKGERQGCAKFTESQVLLIRQIHATGNYRYAELARQFGVSKPTIRSIVLRITWTHI